jgi:hypothetical protein
MTRCYAIRRRISSSGVCGSRQGHCSWFSRTTLFTSFAISRHSSSVHGGSVSGSELASGFAGDWSGDGAWLFSGDMLFFFVRREPEIRVSYSLLRVKQPFCLPLLVPSGLPIVDVRYIGQGSPLTPSGPLAIVQTIAAMAKGKPTVARLSKLLHILAGICVKTYPLCGQEVCLPSLTPIFAAARDDHIG